MKTETFPSAESGAAHNSHSGQNPAAPAQGNAAASARETVVAELQNNNGAGNQGPAPYPAGYLVQPPKNAHPDYQLPADTKVIHVKLSSGETTFHLPANTSFDTIRVIGHDLVLIQKDGTAIVLEGGADKVPNIDIGTIEVPKVALEAAFTANGIQPAEGGQSAPPPSSGGHFDDGNGSGIGNGFANTALLGQEGFTFTPDPLSYPPPDFPSAAINATVAEAVLTVSETHLTAATNGIAGSDPNGTLLQISADFSHDFTFRGDATGGTVRYSLSITGGNGVASGLVDSQTGQADVLVQNGNTIEGHVGNANGALAFTVAVDPNTGVVTFALDRAVIEPQSGSNPSGTFVAIAAGLVNLTGTITDGIGHSAAASLDLGTQIHITDDGPSATANAATVPALTLSEADLTAASNNGVSGTHPNAAAATTVGHFAGDFTDVSGADGLKSTTYALSINGGNGAVSGFVDSQTGLADVLVQNGNTIEGHVGTSTGALAFTITVDPATGDITFTEDRAISNNGTGAAGLSLAHDVVTLTQNLVDNDGTTTSAHIDLGAKLAITDDGPSIVANAATEPSVTLSETNLTAGTNGGTPGSTAGVGPTTAVGHFGHDFTDTSGADGIKSTSYALSINGGNGTASGLTDSQTGLADVLVLNAKTGAIEGHVGTASGALAFTISVDAATGDVTFTEDRAVENNGTGNTGASLAADILTLTQTIVDNDGTTASGSIDLGSKLAITDDGPSVSATGKMPTLSVSESHLTFFTDGPFAEGTDPNHHLTHVTGDFSTAFTDTSGADGIKSTAYSLSITGGNGTHSGLIDSQTGRADVLVQNGNTITGFVQGTHIVAFTIELDPSTGSVTFTEDRAVTQAQDGSDPSGIAASFAAGIISLTQTVTDNDGTTASGSVDLGQQLSITDDGPKISVLPWWAQPYLEVSESNLPNGTDPHSHLTHVTGDFSYAFVDQAGADGAKSISYALSIGNANSGLVDTQTGQAVTLVQNGAHEVDGVVMIGGKATTVFTITVDGFGDVTFTEDRAVENNNSGFFGLSIASHAVLLTQTLTDNDGTATSATLDLGQRLAIADDTPQISLSGTHVSAQSVSESHLPSNSGDDHTPGTSPGASNPSVTEHFAPSFSDNFGADGAKNGSTAAGTAYTLAIGSHFGGTGLTDTLSGEPVTLRQISSTEVDGVVTINHHTVTVFSYTVDSSGDVTFTLDRSVEDNNGSAVLPNNSLTLTQTITDGDGSKASQNLDISKQFSITDDKPQISLTGTTVTAHAVSESNLPSNNGDSHTPGTSPGSHNPSVTEHFAGSFSDNFGADGAGGTAYTLSVASHNGNTGLTDTLTGRAVTLVSNGSHEVDGVINDGHGNQTTVFSYVVDSSGDVTFTLDRSVEDNNGSAVLPTSSLTLTQTITDGDGSTASQNLDISKQFTIADDTPKAPIVTVNNTTIGVDETPGVQHASGGPDDVHANSLPQAIASLFASLTNVGIDTSVPTSALDNHALSFAASGGSVVNVGSLNYGADGAAKTSSETYSLVAGSGAGPVDSGLKLTDGTSISLERLSDGVVVGVVGTDNVNSSLTGKTAFAIAIDPSTGEIYLAQYLSLQQPNPAGDANDPNNYLTLAAHSLGVAVTLTDGDGSAVSSQTADVSGHVQFYDDGPSIASVSAATFSDSSHAQGTWQPVFGADGPNIAAAIGLTAGGSVVDTGTTLNGHELFKVTDGSLVYYEYTVANGDTTTMHAFTDKAGDAFFELTAAVTGPNDAATYSYSGSYSLHLDASSAQATAKDISFLPGALGFSGAPGLIYSHDGGPLEKGIYSGSGSTGALPPANYDLLIQGYYPNGENGIEVTSTGLGVPHFNFGTGEYDGYVTTGEKISFNFGTAQTDAIIGIHGSTPGLFETFTVTIKNGSTSSTETIIQLDGAPIKIDAADWQGSGGFLSGITEIDVENVTAGVPTDSKVTISSIDYSDATSGSTTLNVGLTATDGDGDTSQSANLSINLPSSTPTGHLVPGSSSELVYESGLGDGSHYVPGGNPSYPITDSSVQAQFTAGADAINVTLADGGLIKSLGQSFGNLIWIENATGTEIFGYQSQGAGIAPHLVVSFAITSLTENGITSAVTGQDSITVAAGQTATVTITETLYDPIIGNTGGGVGDLGTLYVTGTDATNPGLTTGTQVAVQVGVADDAPIAHPDTVSVNSGHQIVPNVITGVFESGGTDAQSADGGVTVLGVEKGSHLTDTVTTGVNDTITTSLGTLKMSADGSYTFDAHPNESGTETFTYTIKDADGSTSTSTLTITVNEVQPTTVAVTGTVHESGLSNGSNPVAPFELTSGKVAFSETGDTVTVTGIQPTAVSGIGVAGVPQDPGSYTEVLGAHGALIIDYQGNYTYILSTPENNNPAPDTFTYTVTDSHGNTTTNTLTFNIIDDAPVANADTVSDVSGNTVAADAAHGLFSASNTGGADLMGADGPATGNVVGVISNLTHDNGTSGTAGADGVPYTVQGEYGTLTLNQDGSYSYHANANTTGLTGQVTDTFTYTIQDGDGSTATSTIAVTVNEVHPTANAVVGTVYESGLPNGSHPASPYEAVSGELTLSEPGQAVSVTGVQPTAISGVGVQDVPQGPGTYIEILGAHGELTIDYLGNYTYILTSPENNNPAPDTFTYTVTDSHGNTTTNTLTFNIVDDAPVAHADTITDASTSQILANVITGANETSGADTLSADMPVVVEGVVAGDHSGVTETSGVGTAITTSLGTLTMNADGSYSYQANGSGSGTDVFTYTIKDGDGSPSTATLSIDVQATKPTANPETGTVYEAGLFHGSGQGNTTTQATGQLSFSEPGTTVTLTSVDGTSIPANSTTTVFGAHGELTIQADGSYVYTLTSPEAGVGGVEAPDVFTYLVTDAQGHTASSTLTFTIVDDAPVAHNDVISAASSQTIAGDSAHGLFSNSNSGGADLMGADGPAGGNVIGVTSTLTNNVGTAGAAGADGTPYTVQGEYGTLTLNQDGSYSYQANADTTGLTGVVHDTFSYTIQDGDGSTASATITINVTETPIHPVANAATGTVYEAGLANGSHQGNTTVTQGGTLSFSETGGTVTVTSISDATAGTVNVAQDGSDTTIAGAHGTLTINDNGTYSYTLTSPETNNPTPDVFTYMVTDAHGQTTTNTLTFGIVDDAPHIASVANITVADAANVTGTGTWTGQFGADGQSATAPIGLSMGTAPAGSSYTVTDTGTHTTIGGHQYEISEVQVGGSNPYTFYEYTVASSAGTEMFAFADKGGNNPFFELTVGANGSETFHLDTAALQTSSSSSFDLTNNSGSSSYLYSTNGTTFTASNSIPGSYEVLIQGAFLTGNNQFNVSAGSQGLGVSHFGSAFSSEDLLKFSFGQGQTEVKVGVNAPDSFFYAFESFNVTINGITHNYTQGDGSTLDIKASDFGLTSFSSVSIENVGNAILSDDAVYLSSITLAATQAAAPGQLDFAVSTTDGDGSTSSAPTNLDVTLSASTTPVLGTVTGNGSELVYEAGLASGSQHGPTNTTDNGVTVTFTAGADPVDVTLSAASLVKSFPGFTNLTWVTSADGHEIDGYQGSSSNPANEVVSFVLTGATSIAAGQTGTVTVTETLLHPLEGNNGQGAGDLGALAIIATDHGNSAISTSTSINVGIGDDTPLFQTADHGVIANTDTVSALTGSLSYLTGADAPATLAFTGSVANATQQNPWDTGQMWGSAHLMEYVSNGVLYGEANGSNVFSVTLNASSSTYSFGLLQPLPATTNVANPSIATHTGTSSESYGVYSDSDGNALAVVTGYTAQGSFNVNTWFNEGHDALTSSNLHQSSINTSANGIGVGSNNFDSGDFLRFDVGHLGDNSGADTFKYGTTAGAPTPADANQLTFHVDVSGSKSTTIDYVVHDLDGTVTHGQYVGTDGSFTVTGDGSSNIDYVELYAASSVSSKISLTGVSEVTDSTSSLNLPFSFSTTDHDGSTSAGAFDVTLTGASQSMNYGSDSTILALNGTYHTIADVSGNLGASTTASATNSMIGGAENDIFISQFGSDTMTGGGGNDIFKLENINAHDVITDFGSTDTIDLTAILTSVPSATSLAGYVSYNQNTGVLSVDPAGHSNFTPIATLDTNNNPNTHPTASNVLIAYQEHVNQTLHAHAVHAG